MTAHVTSTPPGSSEIRVPSGGDELRVHTGGSEPQVPVGGSGSRVPAGGSEQLEHVGGVELPVHVGGSELPVTLLVVAKAPVAGFAKTRLTPPLSPVRAARLAGAALLDTLDAVRECGAAHCVVAFTGNLDVAEYAREIRCALDDFDVVPQRGSGLGERLANAHADAGRWGLPVLQIGMDTPQVPARVLTDAGRQLVDGTEAVLGPATDGGWWALGLTDPRAARLLVDVPMSTPHTGECTRNALRGNGYVVTELPTFTDVDYYADALRVAADSTGRFATEVNGLTATEGNGLTATEVDGLSATGLGAFSATEVDGLSVTEVDAFSDGSVNR